MLGMGAFLFFKYVKFYAEMMTITSVEGPVELRGKQANSHSSEVSKCTSPLRTPSNRQPLALNLLDTKMTTEGEPRNCARLLAQIWAWLKFYWGIHPLCNSNFGRMLRNHKYLFGPYLFSTNLANTGATYGERKQMYSSCL